MSTPHKHSPNAPANGPEGPDRTAGHLDLPALIRKAAADNPNEPAPARIAAYVLEQIPRDHERSLLAALLPRFVGETLRRVEQTPATSPRAAWEDLLTDRVPTDDGYRFLRDCTSDDIRAGAVRRRAHAEGLSRRADLYDAIADRLASGLPAADPVPHDQSDAPNSPAAPDPSPRTAGHVEKTPIAADRDLERQPAHPPEGPRPRDLPVREGVDIVVRARGYVPPTGRRLAEIPAHLRPTVNELVDELAMIPADVLAPQLLTEPELLEKLALAQARGWTPPELSELLKSDELLEPFYEALGRVKANLAVAAAAQRATGDERTRKRFGKDAMAVQQRQSEVRKLLHKRSRSRRSVLRTPDERAQARREHDVIRAHQEEYVSELQHLLATEGLPFEPPVSTPSRSEAWKIAVERGWVTNSPEAQQLLALDDAAFREVVATDITGDLIPGLREPGVTHRWQIALTLISEEHRGRELPTEPLARARANRFHAALMQRQGEARRAGKDAHTQVLAHVDHANDASTRQRLRHQARRTILARYPEELT